MVRNIVFGLEDVLVSDMSNGIIDAQSEEVLHRSRKDFDSTTLWTNKDLLTSYKALEDSGLIFYFDSIIGKDSKLRNLKVTMRKNNGSYTGEIETLRKSIYPKNLMLLGNPKKFVLIEGNYHNGFPYNRIVYTDRYVTKKDKDLLEAYKSALNMFD